MNRAQDIRSGDARPAFRWAIRQAAADRASFALVLLANLLSACFFAVFALAAKQTAYAGTVRCPGALIMAAAMLGVAACEACARFFRARARERLARDLRLRTLSALQNSARQSAECAFRLPDDIDEASECAARLLPGALSLALRLFAAFGATCAHDPRPAALAFAIGPLAALGILALQKKYASQSAAWARAKAEENADMRSRLSRLMLTKAYQWTDAAPEAGQARANAALAREGAIIRARALYRLVYGGGFLAAYWLSLGEASPGMPLMLPLFAAWVLWALDDFARAVSRFADARDAIGRVREALSLPREECPPAVRAPERIGLLVENAAFGACEGVRLEVRPGDRVGIVGASGAGKTALILSLLSLIPCAPNGRVRFFDENGSAENASPASRRFISYVPQSGALIRGTVEKNIRFGNENASPGKLLAALDDAGATDFIRALPEGIDTALTGEPGECAEADAQRLALARALLRDKPLFLLDEATSALDEEAEARVLERIAARSDRTLIIASRRRSILRICNKALEIGDDGRAVLRELKDELVPVSEG